MPYFTIKFSHMYPFMVAISSHALTSGVTGGVMVVYGLIVYVGLSVTGISIPVPHVRQHSDLRSRSGESRVQCHNSHPFTLSPYSQP